jgi:hypothetical protein
MSEVGSRLKRHSQNVFQARWTEVSGLVDKNQPRATEAQKIGTFCKFDAGSHRLTGQKHTL